MMETSLAVTALLLLAAGSAWAAVLDRVCTTLGHDPKPVVVRLDSG